MKLIRLAVAAFLLAVLTAPAIAQQAIRLSAPFDAGQLGRDEARTLQAALAFEGTYDALLDGAWGRGSQSALEEWAREATGSRRATWRDVRALLRRYEAERQANGWQPVWHADEQIAHLRPDTMLRESTRGDEIGFVSPDGGLAVVVRRGGLRPIDLHESFAADAAPGETPYRLREDRRIVTSSTMRGGRHAYVRSDLGGGIWMTHIVLSDDANRGRLGLIASSFQRGRLGDVDPGSGRVLGPLLDDGTPPLPEAEAPAPAQGSGDPLESLLAGVLSRALEELGDDDDRTDRAPVQQVPDRRPVQADRVDRPRRPQAGSGFYVNTTDIVTRADLARRCDGVRIAGGADLSLIAVDDPTGIAIFQGPGPVRDFLPLAARPTAEGLGLTSTSRRPEGRGLQTFRGAVRRVQGQARRDGWMRHDMGRPRFGELGAPLLDDDGGVHGVWIDAARADGRSPTSGALARALRTADIPHLRESEPGEADDRAARAVVSLVCAR